MERTILHADCNGFYASVECILNPALAQVPMAVAGDPESRHGIILAKNELAKRYRIQTAETVQEAKRKCPHLLLVPPHHSEYSRYSRLVNEIYGNFTDLIEPFGIDESWLDVTGVTHLFGDGREIADQLRATVKRELGLTISVGVSFNKIFAKLGSDYKKPDGTTVITRENFKSMLHPLPVNRMLYVGKVANQTLQSMGIATIGDLARHDREAIVKRMGKAGETVWDYANGVDDSPVRSVSDPSEMKSVGNGMTFKRNLVSQRDIHLGVTALADEVAARMRRYGVQCGTVQVLIKDPSFKSITRQKALEVPSHLAKEIAQAALELIHTAWKPGAPIRMLTVTGANLLPADSAGEQLSLFGTAHVDRAKQEKLEATMDKIRGKYGREAISLGGVLDNDLGISHKD